MKSALDHKKGVDYGCGRLSVFSKVILVQRLSLLAPCLKVRLNEFQMFCPAEAKGKMPVQRLQWWCSVKHRRTMLFLNCKFNKLHT